MKQNLSAFSHGWKTSPHLLLTPWIDVSLSLGQRLLRLWCSESACASKSANWWLKERDEELEEQEDEQQWRQQGQEEEEAEEDEN